VRGRGDLFCFLFFFWLECIVVDLILFMYILSFV
jgi:hypothetical protein